LRRFIKSIVEVRRGEVQITLLMLAYYYLVLLTYYLLKPARDSLFLVELGAGQLPVVFMITALVIVPLTSLYSSASRSLRLTHLVYASTGIFALSLAVLRWMLTLHSGWVFYVFYVWVTIFGALTASQYWLFANAVFTPTQAKRVFGFLNIGGILGAMTGGEVTGFLVRTLGMKTEDLLWVCLACVAGFAPLSRAVWRRHVRGSQEEKGRARRAGREEHESFARMLRLIRSSRHLSYLVGIVALTMATASFVDYQFKTASLAAFPETERLTSFLGVFYGRVSLVSLLLQVVFAYRFVRVVGVTGVVMLLPLSLIAGSGFMMVAPGLMAAALLRGADGAFLYSIDKTGRELLFLPIPLDIKKRTKVFIDVFVDKWFRGVAGGVLLLLTTVLGMSVRQLSGVVIGLSAVWLVLAVLIRREYVDAFRRAVARRELDPGQLTVNISDAATIRLLRDHLAGGGEREVVYALDMLAGVDDRALADDLRRLLDHPSDEVKKRALEHLRRLGVEPDGGGLDALVRAADPDVRLAAVRFAAMGDGGEARLRAYLDDADPRVAVSALRCAAEEGRRAVVERARVEVLASVAGEARDEVRVEVARSLGALGEPGLGDVIESLAADASRRVAGEALLAMGEARDPAYMPELIARLADPALRASARAALSRFGNDAVDALGGLLADESSDVAVRRHLPGVLSRIATQPSADALTSALGRGDPTMRYRVVKARNKLRRRYPNLGIDGARVHAAFVDEAREYYAILGAAAQRRTHRGRASDRLLSRALGERLDYTLERMFRLLGLRYPADDVYNAYLGVVSAARERRSSAVELLDNVLDSASKRYLLPIIDGGSEAATLARGRELFEVDAGTGDDSLERLIRGSDAWLRACALLCARGTTSPALRRAAEDARRDRDAVVAQTAALVLDESSKGSQRMFTVIEKVILLQSVDVFADISTEQLSYMAAISEEVSYQPGETIYETGEASDSLYLVVEGKVRLHRDGDDILMAGQGDVFGTWALFDDEPRVATATVVEPARALRIDRDDFLELLSEHTEITQGLFKNIVGRLRGLIGRVAPR